MDNIRTLVAESDHRFVDYTVLSEAAKEPEAIKTIRPSSRSVVNSRSVQATGIAARLGRVQAKPMDLTTFYKTISAQGKLAMKQKREQGETMHQAPLGYRNTHQNGKSLLQVDPATYPLVRQAHELYAFGMSIRQICKVMFKRGLRSRRGGRIGAGAMHRVLKRRLTDKPNFSQQDQAKHR